MAKHDLDKDSAAYVKYLRERSELEKQMLLERAEFDPQNPDAYQELIKKRTKNLEEVEETSSRFGETGLGQILPHPWEIFPPRIVPVPFYVDLEVCDLNQTLSVPNATYVILDQDQEFGERVRGPKSVNAHASANPFHWDTSGRIHNGFMTSIRVPPADGPTSVNIRSNLLAEFGWVEANAVGDNWLSRVLAQGHAWLAGPSGPQTASTVTLVNFTALNGQVLSHNDMPTTTLSAVFEISTSVPPGSGAPIDVYETIMLDAVTPNGHAHIGGRFTWQPLSVTMREGCRPRSIAQWRYWGQP